MRSLKLLELFAGSRSIGKAAERRGWEVFSVDIKPFRKIDLIADINTMNVRDVPFIPDCIWASPPCTAFSIAGLSHYWLPGGVPKKDATIGGIRNVINTLHVLRYFAQLNPKLVYYIENPRGMLRKLPVVGRMQRATVTYCKYGARVMKPTDIWTNNLRGPSNRLGWRPRAMCSPGNPNCHHEQCSPSWNCGVQGMRNAFERSKIPAALAREVIKAAETRILGKML